MVLARLFDPRALVQAVALTGVWLVGACASNPLEPEAIAMTGVWSGQLSDSSGPAQVVWDLVESAGALTGSVTIDDPDTGFRARGTVTVVVRQSSVQFSMHIPAGGFDDPYRDCSADVSGIGQLAPTTLTAEYSGTNSCTGPITSGKLTLVKP